MGCGPVGVGDFPDVPIPTVEKKVVQKQAEFLGSETVHARLRDIGFDLSSAKIKSGRFYL
jgi:hypothetical protein